MVDDVAVSEDTLRPSLSTMMCFRVVHLQPKIQKLLTPSGSQLRGDHVAIVPYSILSRDAAAHEMNITSMTARDQQIGTRLISLESFMELGFAQMFAKFVKLGLASLTVYDLPEATFKHPA